VFRVGAQFRIVTIDLEPTESLDKARAMRARYLDRLPEDQRAAARTGWTFLVAATPGDAAEIRRVADAVGFRYTYIKERAEWAHPAALILLSASGVVTRYVYGIEFPPAVLRESIYKAGLAEPAAAVGFLLRCYHYDPDANSHARAGVMALRLGAAGFVLLLFSALGVMHLARRATRRGATPAPPAAPNGVT
jgi:protein SCO1/2